jgi:hypothetical protein
MTGVWARAIAVIFPSFFSVFSVSSVVKSSFHDSNET